MNENETNGRIDTGGENAADTQEKEGQEAVTAQEEAHDAAAEATAEADRPAEGAGEAEHVGTEVAQDATAEEPAKPDPTALLTEKLQRTQARLMGSLTEAAALKLGVRAERVKYAARLADLNGIDAAAEDASSRIEAAIQAVMTELPELAGAAQGTGSPGAFARKKEAPKDAFEKGLEG